MSGLSSGSVWPLARNGRKYCDCAAETARYEVASSPPPQLSRHSDLRPNLSRFRWVNTNRLGRSATPCAVAEGGLPTVRLRHCGRSKSEIAAFTHRSESVALRKYPCPSESRRPRHCSDQDRDLGSGIEREVVLAAPHVGDATCDPDPRSRRKGPSTTSPQSAWSPTGICAVFRCASHVQVALGRGRLSRCVLPILCRTSQMLQGFCDLCR